MLNLSKNIKLEGDKTIWTLVFLLLIISILVVYTVLKDYPSTKSHFRNILIGLITMYLYIN